MSLAPHYESLCTGNVSARRAFVWDRRLQARLATDMQDIAQETIERCQDGNAAAFAEVVDRYERPLFAYVCRLRCTPVGLEPEDVVQEIFLKTYQAIHRFQWRANGSFSTWLFSIARNHCISLIRRRHVEGRRRDADQGDVADVADQRQLGPAEAASQTEAAAHAADAVASLPEPMRSAFVLRYYQDMAYAGIAEVLDCDEGTARTRVARAKKALARYLQGEGNTD